MAPGDRQPSSADGIRQRPIAYLDERAPPTIDEGPSGLAKRQSRLEALQLELRSIFPSLQRNTMFNPVTGGDEAKFFFKLVGSFSASRTVIFGDREVAILIGEQSTYIEPPHLVNGMRLRPLYVQHFIYGEVSPDTMAKDSRIAPEIHEDYVVEFQEEGKKPKYLFPAEPNIVNTLQRISAPPPPRTVGAEPGEELKLDYSALSAYLPKNADEARELLLKSAVLPESFLDLTKIHDTLESSSQVAFVGEEKKTSVPYSIIQVEGGIKYYLYPYGISPPMSAIPQGCSLLTFHKTEDKTLYYLLVPELRLPALFSRKLLSHQDEEGVG